MIDTYIDHGRVIDGDHDQMLDAAYHAWRTDMAAGRLSILIAETAEPVTALNQRARTDRVLAGTVTVEGATLHDGTTDAGRQRRTSGGLTQTHGDRSRAVRAALVRVLSLI